MVPVIHVTAEELTNIGVDFKISLGTLKSWCGSETRAAHLSLLKMAQMMLNRYPEMRNWLTSAGDLESKGRALGLSCAELWNVPGIPSRTLRDWSKNEKYRVRLLGVWLGLQGQYLTSIAAGAYSPNYDEVDTLDKLDQWQQCSRQTNLRARLVAAWLNDGALLTTLLQPNALMPRVDRGVPISTSSMATLKGVLEANRLASIDGQRCASRVYWEGDDGASYRIMRLDGDFLVLSNSQKVPLSNVAPSQLQLRHDLS